MIVTNNRDGKLPLAETGVRNCKGNKRYVRTFEQEKNRTARSLPGRPVGGPA